MYTETTQISQNFRKEATDDWENKAYWSHNQNYCNYSITKSHTLSVLIFVSISQYNHLILRHGNLIYNITFMFT
jgi:hypothetical protein